MFDPRLNLQTNKQSRKKILKKNITQIVISAYHAVEFLY